MYHISCLWIQNVNLMIFEPFKYYFSLETWFSIMLENAPKCHKIAHCKKLVFEAFFFFLNYESILTPIGRKLISSLPQRISEVMKNKGQEFTPISKVFEIYIVVVFSPHVTETY